jgi:hypothetical protein
MMELSTFTPFRFYRHCSDDVVFCCERVKGEKALLHIADMRLFFRGHERRKVVQNDPREGWEMISAKEEYQHLLAYHRDLHRDYHANDSDAAMESAILRRQYYMDPYLADVADEEIRRRIDAIADNMFRFGVNGEVIAPTGAELSFWQRKAEEVLEELGNGREHLLEDHPEISGKKAMIIHLNTHKNNKYINTIPWGAIPKPSGGQLFKFGEARFLRPALEHGQLRITSTSFYGNSDLNSARRDGDEGRTILRPSRTGLAISLNDMSGRTIFGPSERGKKQIAVEIGGDQDFFVWCCSRIYEPRLYVDFQADSCLVIHDAKEFGRRLNKGLLEKIPTLPGMRGSHVRYYDPFLPDDTIDEMLSTPLSLFLFKDLRYMYQAEYRFLWPLKEGPAQPFLNIEVKPLSDICELLVLPTS